LPFSMSGALAFRALIETARIGLEIPSIMVRGYGGRGQTGESQGNEVTKGRENEEAGRECVRQAGLAFGGEGLANVGQEAGVGGADLGIVVPSLVQAQLAVDGEADLGGVAILLAVVFPPANRAKLHRAGSFEGLVSTTGATEADCNCCAHTEMDASGRPGITGRRLVGRHRA